MLDLRIPSGWFFAIIGGILVGMTFVDPAQRAELSDVNINLYCGIVMLFFGALLLALAWNARQRS